MTMPVVGILAEGATAAGIAARLAAHGVRVLRGVESRNASSAARAAAAGMTPVPRGDLAAADAFLSIPPPAEALRAVLDGAAPPPA